MYYKFVLTKIDTDGKFNGHYTKNEANTKYTLKTPNANFLEERYYVKNSITGNIQFDGHYEEHFVIRGYFTNGLSFEINQVISGNSSIKAKNIYIKFDSSSVLGYQYTY